MVSLHVCLNDETIAIIDYDHESAADRRRQDGWVWREGEWHPPQWSGKAVMQGLNYGLSAEAIQRLMAGQPREVIEYPWWRQIQHNAQMENRQLDHVWLRQLLDPYQDVAWLQQFQQAQARMRTQTQPQLVLDRAADDQMRQEGLDMGTQEVYERAFAHAAQARQRERGE